jgi:ubiquitin-like 1-activating enzyme E1 A
MTTTKRKLNEISVDEVSLYDRQIRLWGLKAQENMRNSRILAIGITGLMAEVLKNICLAGIGHLTLMDDGKVKVEDLTNFLVEETNIGQNVFNELIV